MVKYVNSAKHLSPINDAMRDARCVFCCGTSVTATVVYNLFWIFRYDFSNENPQCCCVFTPEDQLFGYPKNSWIRVCTILDIVSYFVLLPFWIFFLFWQLYLI